MKKVLQLFTSTIALIFIGFIIFLLWASSPQLSPNDYEKLTEYPELTRLNKRPWFSIVSYNIGYLSGMTNNKAVHKPKPLFNKNLNRVKKLFDILQADFIALQEIDYNSARSYHTNQQDELSSIGYPYAAQAINWDETYVPFPYWPPSVHFGAVLSGQSILSKYPIIGHDRVVLERVADAPFYRDALYLDRLAQVVQVKVDSTYIVIINVHLEAFDQSTRKSQFETVLELFDQYKDTYPTILLGDFNSQARDPNAAIQQLINRPNIGNAAYDSTSISNTYSAADPFKRIDYIFYNKKYIELIDSAVIEEFGDASDHLPILMQFRLK